MFPFSLLQLLPVPLVLSLTMHPWEKFGSIFSVTTCGGGVEEGRWNPFNHFFEATQTQLSSPLFIHHSLQSPSHLQFTGKSNRGPMLDTVLQLQPHEQWIEGSNHCPQTHEHFKFQEVYAAALTLEYSWWISVPWNCIFIFWFFRSLFSWWHKSVQLFKMCQLTAQEDTASAVQSSLELKEKMKCKGFSVSLLKGFFVWWHTHDENVNCSDDLKNYN